MDASLLELLHRSQETQSDPESLSEGKIQEKTELRDTVNCDKYKHQGHNNISYKQKKNLCSAVTQSTGEHVSV